MLKMKYEFAAIHLHNQQSNNNLRSVLIYNMVDIASMSCHIAKRNLALKLIVSLSYCGNSHNKVLEIFYVGRLKYGRGWGGEGIGKSCILPILTLRSQKCTCLLQEILNLKTTQGGIQFEYLMWCKICHKEKTSTSRDPILQAQFKIL